MANNSIEEVSNFLNRYPLDIAYMSEEVLEDGRITKKFIIKLIKLILIPA